MRDCCMGIIERVRSETEDVPWLAEAGKRAFVDYRKILRD